MYVYLTDYAYFLFTQAKNEMMEKKEKKKESLIYIVLLGRRMSFTTFFV